MTTYFVWVECSCKRCESAGRIVHPEWQELRESRGDDVPPAELDSVILEWFTKRGHLLPPPEEIDCPECEGRGIARMRVPLVELRRLLTEAE